MNLPKLLITVSVVVYLVSRFLPVLFFHCNPEGEGGESGEGGAEVSSVGCMGEGTMAWISLGSSWSSNTAGLWH